MPGYHGKTSVLQYSSDDNQHLELAQIPCIQWRVPNKTTLASDGMRKFEVSS